MQKYGDEPLPITVFVDTKPKPGKPGEGFTSRLGSYGSVAEAKQDILKNENEMKNSNTYGGLIDWGDDEWVRHYRIYRVSHELLGSGSNPQQWKKK